MSKNGEPVTFFAFDLLFLNGEDLRGSLLVDRQKRLRKLIPQNTSRLIYVDHIETEREFVFKHAVKAGMEGVMAKLADSSDVSASSRDWLKFKAPHYHDGWERPTRK